MMTFKKFISPLKKPIQPFEIATWDTETDGLGGDLLLITYYVSDHIKGYCKGTPDEMLSQFFGILSLYDDRMWYAHNAEYDWRYLLEHIVKKNYPIESIIRSDNRVMSLDITIPDFGETKTIKMRDSFLLAPMSLKNFANSFSHLPKLEIDIEHFNVHDPSHIEYAIRDAETLFHCLKNFNGMVEEKFGVTVSMTTASTSMRAWRKTLRKSYPRLNPIFEDFSRKAYFGGYVFITDSRKITEPVYPYDINSSYVSSMEDGVPSGLAAWSKTYDSENPGIWKCRVKTPDDLIIPILPARVKKGSAFVTVWCKGEFTTYVTSQEINFALKHGYEIEVIEGIVFEKIIKPFENFVLNIKALRKLFKGKPPETVAKLLGNALYGKLNAKPEGSRLIRIGEGDDDLILGLRPFDDAGNFFVLTEEIDQAVMPHWGAWITASSRLKLLTPVYEDLEPINCIYGDTDSIKSRKKLNSRYIDQLEFGKFKQEDEAYKEFRAHAPKVYSALKADGTRLMRAKGIPRLYQTDETSKKIMEGEHFDASFQSLKNLRQVILSGTKDGKFEKGLEERTRALTKIENCLSWELRADGTVHPRAYSDILESMGGESCQVN